MLFDEAHRGKRDRQHLSTLHAINAEAEVKAAQKETAAARQKEKGAIEAAKKAKKAMKSTA